MNLEIRKRYLYFKFFLKRLYLRTFFEKTRNIHHIKEHSICGHLVHSQEDVNEMLSRKIESGCPFALLRPGNGEYALTYEWDEHVLFHTNRYKSQKMANDLKNDYDAIRRFAEGMENDFKDCDIFAVFRSAFLEYYLIEAYSNPEDIIYMDQLYSMEKGVTWLQALKGKKVLFISPFTDTMERQYEQIDKIWGGYDVLPEIIPVFLKSVWVMNCEDDDFESWFEALEYLTKEMKNLDFDILLAGCGSFSTFLVAEAKRMGKQAIQYGGALQLLFGIKGKRWDDGEYSKYYNEYWVRPSEEETPRGKLALDNGCYW